MKVSERVEEIITFNDRATAVKMLHARCPLISKRAYGKMYDELKPQAELKPEPVATEQLELF